MGEYIICVFGSGGVGKSCLVGEFILNDLCLIWKFFKTMQFVQNIFMTKYDPTIEDVYTTVKYSNDYCLKWIKISF